MIFEVMINARFYGVEIYITSLLFFHSFISHLVNFIVIRRLFHFSSIREKLVRFHSRRIHTHIINFFYTWHFFFSLQLPAEIYLKTSFYFDVLFWIIFSSDFVADLPFLESKPISITHTILKDTWNFSVFVID